MQAGAKNVIAISVRNLSISVQDKGQTKSLLSDVNFEIEQGKFVAVIGASGCGKSTLIKSLAGLIHPSTGQILFAGQTVQDLNDHLPLAVGYDPGWERLYTYTIREKFGDTMDGVYVAEVFDNPTAWNQASGCNWPAPSYDNGHTDQNSQFVDRFAYSTIPGTDTPSSVHPGSTGASQPTIDNNQVYKIGGDGNPGVWATGFNIFEDALQLCRGTAHR